MAIPFPDIRRFLETFAPLHLAEEWDNVGLLLGNAAGDAERIMTCLTLTPDVAAEAIKRQADLIVTHHPILFRAVKSLTSETHTGQMLLDLVRANIAVYSPHTAFDSARDGINQQLAKLLELKKVAPLRPNEDGGPGSGRWGELHGPLSLHAFAERVADVLKVRAVQFVGDSQQQVLKVGIACGAAAEYLRDARSLGCDVLLTGEARFHDCLEARATGIGLVLPGHYASERFACEELAHILAKEFPKLTVWVSEVETDPLQWSEDLS